MGADKDRILLGWKEVAEYLGCSVATAARRENDGLPVFRSGGQLRAFEDDIDNWLKGLRNTGAFDKVPDLRVESLEASEDVQGIIATLINDDSGERVVVLKLGKAKTEYEKIELLLKNVEEKYNVLVDEVPEWVWEMNAKGEFVFSNRRITEILGYLPEEIVGYTLNDFLVYSEDRFDCEKMFLSLVKDKQIVRGYRCRFTHRDNTIRYIELSCKPIFDNQGLYTGISGISRDVTDRIQLENDISRNRLYLDSILENTPDAIFTADENGIINNWNKQAEKMLGFKEGEVIGKGILSISNISEDPAAFDGFLSDIDDNGGTLLVEKLKIERKDGQRKTVSIRYSIILGTAGNAEGVIAIIQDAAVSEKKLLIPDTFIQTKRTDIEESS